MGRSPIGRDGIVLPAGAVHADVIRGLSCQEQCIMLRWALTFLVLALVAGLLGFTGVAGESMAIARILFFIFLIVFIVSAIMSLMTGRRPSAL